MGILMKDYCDLPDPYIKMFFYRFIKQKIILLDPFSLMVCCLARMQCQVNGCFCKESELAVSYKVTFKKKEYGMYTGKIRSRSYLRLKYQYQFGKVWIMSSWHKCHSIYFEYYNRVVL